MDDVIDDHDGWPPPGTRVRHRVHGRVGTVDVGQTRDMRILDEVPVLFDGDSSASIAKAKQLDAVTGPPGRVVDVAHRGWWLVGGGGPSDPPGYMDTDSYLHGSRPVPYPALAAERGPLRPVLPVTDDDVQALHAELDRAGTRAVYTLAVALHDVRRTLYERHPVDTMEERRFAIDRSKDQLRAGRPGSWEADRLWHLSLWADPEKSRRIHADALPAMTEILLRWVDSPDRYTEVAETLAAIVSRHADDRGGWAKVADQWLRPGPTALDAEGIHLTYGFLYSCSEHWRPLDFTAS